MSDETQNPTGSSEEEVASSEGSQGEAEEVPSVILSDSEGSQGEAEEVPSVILSDSEVPPKGPTRPSGRGSQGEAGEIGEVEEAQEVEEVALEKEEPAYKAKLINFSELKAGQTVRIHERIIDISPKGEERQRVQVFEGIIIGLRGIGVSRTLTVRKVSGGVGVEKIYPINSPVIAKIELVKSARTRRAKLTFLTNLRRRFKRKFKETYVK